MQTVKFEHRGFEVNLFTHDPPDHLFNEISRLKDFYEIDLLRAAASLYPKGSWVIDVGANIGNHTVFFAKVLSAHVMSFEPFPANWEILVRNIAANHCSDLVRAEASALGRASGRGTARLLNASNYGVVTIEPTLVGDLPIATLDDFVTLNMSVSIIKVDVEGAELAVLEGASNTLAFHKPHLFIEAAEQSALEEIEGFLKAFGYQVRGRFCATPTYLFSV